MRDNGVEIQEIWCWSRWLRPTAVLTDDERRLGVALVDIGGGTTDLAIYLDDAPWHTVIMDVGGDHFVRDVATGLRMPYAKAEALIKQFGHALPLRVPADAEVRCGAFGEEGQQTINRRALSEILNARAEDVIDLLLREVKRSGYDGLLPAGMVLTGGVAQLTGFAELSRDQLQWPVSDRPATGHRQFGDRPFQPGVCDRGRPAAVGQTAMAPSPKSSSRPLRAS